MYSCHQVDWRSSCQLDIAVLCATVSDAGQWECLGNAGGAAEWLVLLASCLRCTNLACCLLLYLLSCGCTGRRSLSPRCAAAVAARAIQAVSVAAREQESAPATLGVSVEVPTGRPSFVGINSTKGLSSAPTSLATTVSSSATTMTVPQTPEGKLGVQAPSLSAENLPDTSIVSNISVTSTGPAISIDFVEKEKVNWRLACVAERIRYCSGVGGSAEEWDCVTAPSTQVILALCCYF